jgi:hypothetical protein
MQDEKSDIIPYYEGDHIYKRLYTPNLPYNADPSEKCTTYLCSLCNKYFHHYYGVTPDIFENMRLSPQGIKCEKSKHLNPKPAYEVNFDKIMSILFTSVTGYIHNSNITTTTTITFYPEDKYIFIYWKGNYSTNHISCYIFNDKIELYCVNHYRSDKIISEVITSENISKDFLATLNKFN